MKSDHTEQYQHYKSTCVHDFIVYKLIRS